jgi:hypothetical protein
MNSPQPLVPPSLDSVPISCSLDAAGLADRRAEFNSLFATTLVSQEREPLELRLALAVREDAESPVRDLFRRERECCPFFAFTLRRAGDILVITIGVPDGAEAALDALAEMARRRIRQHLQTAH